MESVNNLPLRIGLIGAGHIVESVHLPVLSKMPDVIVSGLFDPNQDRALSVASHYGILNVCRSLEDLFGLGLDVVLVACPNHLHAAMSISALKANLHVLCEKPMATNTIEATAMVEAAVDTGKELLIGFANRFRPEIIALQQLIRNGQLGEITSIRCGWLRHKGVPGINTWFTNHAQSGGGALTDLGSHLIDLAVLLSGRHRLLATCCIVNRILEPEMQASWYLQSSIPIATLGDVEVSASGFAILDGPLDIFIEVSWACAVPYDQTYLSVIGKRGIARLDTLFGLSPNGSRPEYPLQIWLDGQLVPQEIIGTTNVLQPYQDQWRFFIDNLQNGRSLRPQLYENLTTVQVVETMYKSAEQFI